METTLNTTFKKWTNEQLEAYIEATQRMLEKNGAKLSDFVKNRYNAYIENCQRELDNRKLNTPHEQLELF